MRGGNKGGGDSAEGRGKWCQSGGLRARWPHLSGDKGGGEGKIQKLQ